MVAPSKSTVVLRGESGTGKEVIARAIHNLSSRKQGPFIKVNCAALPDTCPCRLQHVLLEQRRLASVPALSRSE